MVSLNTGSQWLIASEESRPFRIGNKVWGTGTGFLLVVDPLAPPIPTKSRFSGPSLEPKLEPDYSGEPPTVRQFCRAHLRSEDYFRIPLIWFARALLRTSTHGLSRSLVISLSPSRNSKGRLDSAIPDIEPAFGRRAPSQLWYFPRVAENQGCIAGSVR